MKIIIFILALLVSLIKAAQREYYTTLGINQNATEKEIKQAWRKLSRQYHPDNYKGDDAQDKQTAINVAYEVLSDPEKRKKYDKHGLEGLKEQPANQSPFGGLFGQQDQEQKGPDMFIKIQVTLEDIYIGRDVPIYLTKRIVCPHCRGTGADDPDKMRECPSCKGKGFTLKTQTIMLGFQQQVQVPCDRCSGTGNIITKKCTICKGKKIINGEDQMSLFIEKGINDGHTIKYENAGDDHDDMASSDVIFQIIQIPHPIFERKGNNLYANLTITLEEALLGFKKKIKHLDGHYVKINKERVTQPGEVQKFEGEGMPQHEFSSNYGDLLITYNVEFPTGFNDEQLELWADFFRE